MKTPANIPLKVPDRRKLGKLLLAAAMFFQVAGTSALADEVPCPAPRQKPVCDGESVMVGNPQILQQCKVCKQRQRFRCEVTVYGQNGVQQKLVRLYDQCR